VLSTDCELSQVGNAHRWNLFTTIGWLMRNRLPLLRKAWLLVTVYLLIAVLIFLVILLYQGISDLGMTF